LLRTLASVFALILCLVPGSPQAGQAERIDTGSFDVELRGFRAGVLAFSGAQNDTSYAASARMESAGLVRLMRQLRFDASARGRVTGGRLAPQSYNEDMNTGRRESRTVMAYQNGIPQVVAREPWRAPQPHDIDPASQAGTLDPMTALYALLRDVPQDQACQMNLQLFDGRRRTQVSLRDPLRSGASVICTGEFRRVAGYSPNEMAEGTRFPFELVYGPAGNDSLRVMRLTVDSIHGTARLVRR